MFNIKPVSFKKEVVYKRVFEAAKQGIIHQDGVRYGPEALNGSQGNS